MRKQIEITEDPTIDPGMAVADIYLEGQARPFVVRGIAESVIQAAKRAPSVRMEVEPTVAVKPAVKAPERPQVVALHGREYVRATVKAKLFDFMYKTTEYDELERTRLLERRLRLRQELGTMPVDVCRKHQHLVDRMQ